MPYRETLRLRHEGLFTSASDRRSTSRVSKHRLRQRSSCEAIVPTRYRLLDEPPRLDLRSDICSADPRLRDGTVSTCLVVAHPPSCRGRRRVVDSTRARTAAWSGSRTPRPDGRFDSTSSDAEAFRASLARAGWRVRRLSEGRRRAPWLAGGEELLGRGPGAGVAGRPSSPQALAGVRVEPLPRGETWRRPSCGSSRLWTSDVRLRRGSGLGDRCAARPRVAIFRSLTAPPSDDRMRRLRR